MCGISLTSCSLLCTWVIGEEPRHVLTSARDLPWDQASMPMVETPALSITGTAALISTQDRMDSGRECGMTSRVERAGEPPGSTLCIDTYHWADLADCTEAPDLPS